MQNISIFWFRRDLRLLDNHGLHKALKNSQNVLPIFIFDDNILAGLDPDDLRINFIHRELLAINNQLHKWGSVLHVFKGYPLDIFIRLHDKYRISAVFTNRDYEPYGIARDSEIRRYFELHDIPFFSFKDQVLFETDEISKGDGNPYSVYTPYSNKWKEKLANLEIRDYEITTFKDNFWKNKAGSIPTIQQLGFIPTELDIPPKEISQEVLQNYDQTRDYPALNGTSRLSVHLRFGTISIRRLVKRAMSINQKFLDELIWREFYMMILWHHPRVVTHSFKPKYDQIEWRNCLDEFNAWCRGDTGYPMVDAGMRQLNATGYMHNRVRMIAASFLTKHLLIDWRWGETYFGKKLLDYELSSNNGGWQWAAGSGCDAAPYFRIFNPEIQLKKFDPDLKYVNKWIPEYHSPDYRRPIVDHKRARTRAINTYKKYLAV